MGMTTDVEVGFLVFQNGFYLRQVMPWIATNVSHVNIHVLYMEE